MRNSEEVLTFYSSLHENFRDDTLMAKMCLFFNLVR